MGRPVLIGIAGASGSGKTTIASALREALGTSTCVSVCLDSYYRDRSSTPEALRAGLNFDEPRAIDSDLLHEQLRDLSVGREVRVPVYDFVTHRRRAAVHSVRPERHVIVEGIFTLYWPRVRDILDLKVFLDVDVETCRSRRETRDVAERGRRAEDARRQWSRSVLPMYERHVLPTARHADVVLDCSSPIVEIVEQLAAAVRARNEVGA